MAPSQVHESPDLFARIVLSIEDDRTRRRQRWRGAAVLACLVGALGAVLFAVIDTNEGELLMDWWILELLTTLFLIGLALWLGPFIKRFGRSYAADVFRANPGTGKSFIVLTDVAYYLIFLSLHPLHDHLRPAVRLGRGRQRRAAQARGVAGSPGSC